MEYLDLVDENDNVIGNDTRKNINNKNLKNYRAIDIFIINNEGQIILARRSKNKKFNAGCYFFSVGGHVMSKESYEEAAYRELKEELGIKNHKLEEIGYFSPYQNDVSSFLKIYRLKYDGNYIINDEIERMELFSKEELDKLVISKPEVFSSDFVIVYKSLKDKLYYN